MPPYAKPLPVPLPSPEEHYRWTCRLCPPGEPAQGRVRGSTAAQLDALIHIAAAHPQEN